MMLDYIIVGQGIAGTMLAHYLCKSDFNIKVIDNNNPYSASNAAEGLMNPITGRKYVKSWLFDEIYPFAKTAYREIEKELGQTFLHDVSIYRFLKSVKEQNDWLEKTADPAYRPYLESDQIVNADPNIFHGEYGGFVIKNAARLDVPEFVAAYKKQLQQKDLLIETAFDHGQLKIKEDSVTYQGLTAKNIIFCEGIGVLQNPWFNWLPIVGTKGQALIIESNEIPEDHVYIGKKTIAPFGRQQFWLGGTYEWSYDNDQPTEAIKNDLIDQYNTQCKAVFTIKNQHSGVRPTVKNRRPIIGRHPKHQNLLIFNGMGTKGISLSPYFAQQFVGYLKDGMEMNEEVRVERYYD